MIPQPHGVHFPSTSRGGSLQHKPSRRDAAQSSLFPALPPSRQIFHFSRPFRVRQPTKGQTNPEANK